MTTKTLGVDDFIGDIVPFFHKRRVTYVDVGAFQGEVFKRVLASPLNVGEAHLVEPNPESIRRAKESVSGAFKGQSLNFYDIALGARAGRVRMRAGKSMTKVVEASSATLDANANIFEVDCTTLDALSTQFTERHVSILKVDVEGFELQVLEGADELLREGRIDVVYIEAGMNPQGLQQCYYRDIEDVLMRHGYKLFRIYEQQFEWIADSPLLRRVNLAYMSPAFVKRNPYQLTLQLHVADEQLSAAKRAADEAFQRVAELETETGVLRDQCAVAAAELAAAESVRRDLLVQIAQHEQRLRDAAARSEVDAVQLKALRSIDESRCAEITALNRERDALMRTLEDSEKRRQTSETELASVATRYEHAQAGAIAERNLAIERRDEALAAEQVLRSEHDKLEGEFRASARIASEAGQASREVFDGIAELNRRTLHFCAQLEQAQSDSWRMRNRLETRLRRVVSARKGSARGLLSMPLALLRELRSASDGAARHVSAAPVIFQAGKRTVCIALTLKPQRVLLPATRMPQEVWVKPLFPTLGGVAKLDVTADTTGPEGHRVTIDSGEMLLAQGRARRIAATSGDTAEGVLELRRSAGEFCLLKIELRPSTVDGTAGDTVRPQSQSKAPPRQLTTTDSPPKAKVPVRAVPVADLVKKLWGGFSTHALGDLDRVITAPGAGSQDKAAAAWELARFHAAEGEWRSTLDALRAVRQFDKAVMRKKRVRLLEVEALAACAEFDKAEELARFAIDNGGQDGDYCCALSNIMVARVSAQSGLSAHVQRLELLNQIYRTNDLSEVGFAQPEAGFVFGNLKGVAATVSAAAKTLKVSVLVPVYNAETFLEVALRSLLVQTWGNLQLVVVDDCSTDASWQIIERLASSDPRILCARNSCNVGAYGTRNHALSLATGDFVTVHDSDDWSHPQMIESQVRAMLADSNIRITFSAMARVSRDLRFALRPERVNMEYVHRSYPSLMMRRSDLLDLDKWDGVAANADDEFVQRARMRWGSEALRDVLPLVPMSLFLKHEASLTSQAATSLRSLTFGVRHEYARQAAYWRAKEGKSIVSSGRPFRMDRTSMKLPFPIPSNLAPRNWKTRTHYDLVVISDLSLLGGTRRCNEGYVSAALAMGMKIGLFHWPRYDLALVDDIAQSYRDLSYKPDVDILTAEQSVSCGLLLIHHPPILKYRLDAVPRIRAETVGILVNQLPRQLIDENDHYYDLVGTAALVRELFDQTPMWIPISPLVRRLLRDGGFGPLAAEDWIPPLGTAVHRTRAGAESRPGGIPVIGRHSRDHWTKWPEAAEDLKLAYCADTSIPAQFLGGTRSARKIIGDWPANWTDHPFDSMRVDRFLRSIDFFAHYTHSRYIEEFGRNIMEAMAAGVPTIVPPRFVETFGDAAVYAEPGDVQKQLLSLWNNPDAYKQQMERGWRYVERFATIEHVQQRLRRLCGTFTQEASAVL